MIRSMTGFGRGEISDGKRNVVAEIRSVNHKYSEIAVHMSKRYAFAEEDLKKAVKETVSRGKMNLNISVDYLTEEDSTVRLNTIIAKQYYDSLQELKAEFGLEDRISLEYLASLPDVIRSVPEISDEQEIIAVFTEAVLEAVRNMDKMRAEEGEKLAADLIVRGRRIREMVDEIGNVAPEVAAYYRKKLKERISELCEGQAVIPEERIAGEVAIFADKSNITEEIVRLRSHCDQLEKILTESTKPCGKKLDFLVQEMNREANTICSKANFLEITNTALDIKSEIEKIREQVQNIE